MSENIASFSERFGRRIKTAVENVEKISASLPTANKATILAAQSSPVEITDEWTLDGGTWKCRAKRLWRVDGTYQTINDGVEFDLYHPTSGDQPTQGIGERVFAVFRGAWELVAGVGGGTGIASDKIATVIIPICRAINPNVKGDWAMPFGNTYQTEHNSRTHYAAQCGYIAIDGKNYFPAISHVDEFKVTHYLKNIRVSSDVVPDGFAISNAHYRVINDNRTNVLQRPVIVYNEDNGNEWKPWDDGIWETTTDPTQAFHNYDLAACPTLDYSEVLVPGERVKALRTDQHSFWKRGTIEECVECQACNGSGQQSVPCSTCNGTGDVDCPNCNGSGEEMIECPICNGSGKICTLVETLVNTTTTVTIVEPPDRYTAEFEGTSDAHEFGVWNKERKLTNNQSDVVHTTINANFGIGVGGFPYDYWGFDTVALLPNGNATWNFVDIAAFPKLEVIQNPNNSPDIDDTWASRPTLTDTVNISNAACNTRAYGLWYKTDRDGIRYPILCNVESLTFGTVIETRRVNCYIRNKETNECERTWAVFKIPIERRGNRLVLPENICAVNCDAAKSNAEVIVP